MDITAYEIPLAPVTSFKYLGIVLLKADDDWSEVVSNISPGVWQKWALLTRVLIREGADACSLGQI